MPMRGSPRSVGWRIHGFSCVRLAWPGEEKGRIPKDNVCATRGCYLSHPCFFSSTRRFLARPSSLPLSAMGWRIP